MESGGGMSVGVLAGVGVGVVIVAVVVIAVIVAAVRRRRQVKKSYNQDGRDYIPPKSAWDPPTDLTSDEVDRIQQIRFKVERNMATRIQSAWKKHREVKHQKITKAASTIQSTFRAFKEAQQLKLNRTKAAVKIQRYWRSAKEREKLAKERFQSLIKQTKLLKKNKEIEGLKKSRSETKKALQTMKEAVASRNQEMKVQIEMETLDRLEKEEQKEKEVRERRARELKQEAQQRRQHKEDEEANRQETMVTAATIIQRLWRNKKSYRKLNQKTDGKSELLKNIHRMSNLRMEEQQKMKTAAFGFAKQDTDELFQRMKALQKLKSKTQMRSAPQRSLSVLLKKKPGNLVKDDKAFM